MTCLTDRPRDGDLTAEELGQHVERCWSDVGGSALGSRTFVHRDVLPDSELIDISDIVGAMQHAGLEVRDVESLREHYTATLRRWLGNLEASWEDAVQPVGVARPRIWKRYMGRMGRGFR